MELHKIITQFKANISALIQLLDPPSLAWTHAKVGDDDLISKLLMMIKKTNFTSLDCCNTFESMIANTLPDMKNVTLLQFAAASGDMILAKALIDAGADIDAMGAQQTPALQIAIFKGKEDVAKLLINAGADVNINNGITPLGIATMQGNYKIVQFLLEKGAIVDHPKKFTPLYWAASYNQIEVARLLLSKGANVEPENSPLKTALFYCNSKNIFERKRKWTENQKNDCTIFLRFCNLDLIELLLANGADPDQGESSNLHWAIFSNNEGVLRLLLKYGANVNQIMTKFSR